MLSSRRIRDERLTSAVTGVPSRGVITTASPRQGRWTSSTAWTSDHGMVRRRNPRAATATSGVRWTRSVASHHACASSTNPAQRKIQAAHGWLRTSVVSCSTQSMNCTAAMKGSDAHVHLGAESVVRLSWAGHASIFCTLEVGATCGSRRDRVGPERHWGVLERYEGHILGLATGDGRRVVVGRWLRSPWGPFADVMTEDASGRRTLLAPSRRVADEVGTTYVFDDVVLTPVSVRCDRAARRWRVVAGPLALDATLGRRTLVGMLLAALPRPVARSRAFAAAADPVARVLVPGVRTVGSAGAGRREWYGATGQHAVVAVDGTWDGASLGPLLPTVPPVSFGFSSVPHRPTVTAVRTTIAVPVRPPDGGSARP